jgi:CheY-like chemotaxis protein
MKKKILLVEDDELDVISVQRTLNNLDVPYSLYTAFNGVEALQLLMNKEEPLFPDVVLLDLNMPKMNGVEFLKNIRKDVRFNELKIFIMTTSSETVDRTMTEGLGISGYFLKPLSYSGNTKRSDSMDAFVQFHLRKILAE